MKTEEKMLHILEKTVPMPLKAEFWLRSAEARIHVRLLSF